MNVKVNVKVNVSVSVNVTLKINVSVKVNVIVLVNVSECNRKCKSKSVSVIVNETVRVSAGSTISVNVNVSVKVNVNVIVNVSVKVNVSVSVCVSECLDGWVTHSLYNCAGQKESRLASLVCTLVCMTRSLDGTEYDEVSAEAGRCLGIIGPIDVGFVILRPLPVENELELALQCMQNDEDMKRFCRIFHALNIHLVDAE